MSHHKTGITGKHRRVAAWSTKLGFVISGSSKCAFSNSASNLSFANPNTWRISIACQPKTTFFALFQPHLLSYTGCISSKWKQPHLNKLMLHESWVRLNIISLTISQFWFQATLSTTWLANLCISSPTLARKIPGKTTQISTISAARIAMILWHFKKQPTNFGRKRPFKQMHFKKIWKKISTNNFLARKYHQKI